MAAEELEIIEIHGKQYVPVRAAIKYLHTSWERMQDLISLEVIPVTHIESRRLIELEFLQSFTMPPHGGAGERTGANHLA